MKFSMEGIKPDENRIKALLGLKSSNSKLELQRLLGAFNYLRQFIPNMSTLITPFRELLKKNVCWVWIEAHTEILNKLKQIVASPQVLVN